VVFSGEGADEFFAGYNIYREPESLRPFSYTPDWTRKLASKFASILPEGVKGKSYLERGSQKLEDRFIGNAKIFTEEAKQQILAYQFMANRCFKSPHQYIKPLYERAQEYDDVTKMQYIDIHTWLRGDILMKADKMSMAHSLELRVPFLDTKVFEFAATIPTKYKLAEGTTKYILREAMKDFVPSDVYMRKKLGFPVPIRMWLRHEYYEWAKQVITASKTGEYINKTAMLQMLEKHRSGKIDYSRKLWTVLIFMLWHQMYIEEKQGKKPDFVSVSSVSI
jgi:asparagine synthase (glutamine-hydrolysing)